MQHLAVGDIRLVGKLVERFFEPRHQRVNRFRIRLFRARRRHYASAQLPYGLFEKLGILGDAGDRGALETDAADFGFVVMATRTVLLDGGEVCLGRVRPFGGGSAASTSARQISEIAILVK